MGIFSSSSNRQTSSGNIPDSPRRSLDLSNRPSSDWQTIFSKFSQQDSLSEITLMNCQLSDSDLKNLSNIRSIEVLDLSDNKKIGNLGVKYLMELPHLRKLIINGECQIGRTGFIQILQKGLTIVQMTLPHITSLAIQRLRIGDRGAQHISNCIPNLKTLIVVNCGLTSAGIAKIAKSLPITKLYAENNAFGDETAIIIARYMPQLISLSLGINKNYFIWQLTHCKRGIVALHQTPPP